MKINFILTTACALYVISNTLDTIINKAQDMTIVSNTYYYHPVIQNIVYWAFAMPCLLFAKFKNIKAIHLYYFVILGAIDAIASLFMVISIFLISPSLYQIISSTITFFAAFFSWLILKESSSIKELATMVLMSFGYVIVHFSG